MNKLLTITRTFSRSVNMKIGVPFGCLKINLFSLILCIQYWIPREEWNDSMTFTPDC